MNCIPHFRSKKVYKTALFPHLAKVRQAKAKSFCQSEAPLLFTGRKA